MGGETWFSNSWKIPAKRRVGLKVIPNNYPTTMDHPYTASKGYSGVLLTFFQDDILNGCRCCPSSRFSRPITWQWGSEKVELIFEGELSFFCLVGVSFSSNSCNPRNDQIVVLQEEEKVQRVAACKSIDEFLGNIAWIVLRLPMIESMPRHERMSTCETPSWVKLPQRCMLCKQFGLWGGWLTEIL